MDDDSLRLGIEALNGRLTELVTLSRGLALNHVLWSGTKRIPSAGFATLETSVPFASVLVGAWAAAGQVTAVTAPPGDPTGPPTQGEGVLIVPPGLYGCVPMVGLTLTVYGVAGDPVFVALLDRLQPPSGS